MNQIVDHIYYINLEHRKDRNDQILEEFARMGIDQYERFPAIYHKEIGGVGCGRSHIAVLEDALEKGYKQILVLEDDFMFCVSPEEFTVAMDALNSVYYDVCLLSYHLYESTKTENPMFRKVLNAETTSGYIIKREYYQKLIDVFREGVDEFEKTNHHWLYSIDVMWKKLQQQDNWICFTQRIGKQRASYSDCSNTLNAEDW